MFCSLTAIRYTTSREVQMNPIKLSPVSDAQIGNYDAQLTFALTDPDMKNIALSGPYGAGKSSILATYKLRHPELKFLHISFAHFQDTSRADGHPTDEKRLEGKIINQLIHQLPAQAIPQTHFPLLREVDRAKVKGYIYWAIFWLLLLAFICFHDAWCGLVDSLSLESIRSLLGMTQRKEAVLVAAVICVILAARGLTDYICLQRNQRILRKVNFKGANVDIELFSGENDSYFDRYLNEVLYLFDHVDADVVVFEDIDRYDRNLIFERLREINVLANCIRGQERKPLRFLFLIRDDLFTTKDRTKFFDVIIPVVPVMDGSNSYAMLIRLFGQLEEDARPGDEFLRGVSLYIDDMRLLRNIFNEYSVYYCNYKESNEIELNVDKLLAMVIYKNLFPADYSMLHRGKGYVYTLFYNKPQLVCRKREELPKQLQTLEERLEEIQQEVFRDMNELDAAYYAENRRTRIQATGEEDISFSSRAKYIEAIKANSYEIEYYSVDYYSSGRWVKENVRDKFDRLRKNPEYLEHKAMIEKRADAENLRQQIAEVKNALETLEIMPLREMIDNGNADEIFGATYTNALGEVESYADVKRSSYFSLIPYLVRSGYIDESYQDYMSYYYADGLRREDKVFLRSLLEHNYKGAAYRLEEPCKVVGWMHSGQFETAECLNYQLLDALLLTACHPGELPKGTVQRGVDCEDRLRRLIRYVFKNRAMDFFDGYLWHGKYAADFVEQMNRECENAATWVLGDEMLGARTKCKYAMQTILHADTYRSRDLEDRQRLSEYVGQNTQFLYAEFAEGEEKRFVEGIELFQVKFQRLVLTDEEWDRAEDPDRGTTTLKNNFGVLQQVYQRQLYVINVQNITALLRIFYKLPPQEIALSKLLTLIYLKDGESLKEYVDRHLEECLSALAETDELLEDGEDMILLVLNREDLPEECKEKYVAAMACRREISLLKQVQDKALWPMLMDGHVLAAPYNLTDYYFLSGNGMDEALVRYINSYPHTVTLSRGYLDSKYGKDAAQSLYMDIIRCNSLCREKYNALARSFPFTCDAAAVGEIDEEKMRTLISKQTIPMTVDNLQYIRERYPKLAFVFARRNIAQYMDLFRSDETAYREEEFLSVMVSDRVMLAGFLANSEEPMERKQKALAKCVNTLKLSTLVRYLKSLELTEFIGLLKGEQTTLERSPGNETLLEAFLSKNWIEEYNVDEQDDTLLQARGKAILSRKNIKE